MTWNRGRRWFLGATDRRVVLEAALLAAGLASVVALVFGEADLRLRAAVLAVGAMETGLLAGLLGAARLAPVTGGWRAAFPREAARAMGLALGVWAAIALVGLASVAWHGPLEPPDEAWEAWLPPVVFGGFGAIATLASFTVCHLLRRAWQAWNHLRRRRLRWALTHALLVASLALAVIGATLLTAADLGVQLESDGLADPALAASGPLQTVLSRTLLRVIPSAVAIFLFSLAIGVVIAPPVAAIGFPVLGRATRRLEELAGATAALRGGDLAARSPVRGEDEIARVQADFNAMAESLQRAQAALREERDAVARLLAERRELTAAVSHELRTPVTTLRGYLEGALGRWDAAPPELRRDLEIMAAETERLQRLIDDLFSLSRAELGQLPLHCEAVAVAPLLRRVAETAAPLAWARGRVEVVAQAPEGLPAVRADATRLEQALRNLVVNAVRHTPPGGLVLLTAEADAAGVTIQVRDTGEGIAAADLPHIWDRFSRGQADDAATEREGAGLGLALVKELTEAMGGTVAVESAPGEGSCFTLRLPLA